MGCFDTINVYMECPYCKRYQHFDCQTKDMDSSMWTFRVLDSDWFKSKDELFGREFRRALPVFKRFPYDKEGPWKSQVEKIEASAMVSPEWGKKLRFVNVTVDCCSTKCDTWARERDRRAYGYESGFGRMFNGKIRIIRKGDNYYFVGPIYDIIKRDNRLPRKIKKKR